MDIVSGINTFASINNSLYAVGNSVVTYHYNVADATTLRNLVHHTCRKYSAWVLPEKYQNEIALHAIEHVHASCRDAYRFLVRFSEYSRVRRWLFATHYNQKMTRLRDAVILWDRALQSLMEYQRNISHEVPSTDSGSDNPPSPILEWPAA